MRTIGARQQAVIDGGLKGYRLKVELKDGLSQWRDMSTYPGFDSVVSASWDENIDDGMASASVEFIRELDGLSIAPLVSSGPNNTFDPTASNYPPISVNNEIKIYVAVNSGDGTPASGDYELFFHGIIDSYNASDFIIKVECRDMAGKLTDAYIEKERVYAIAAVSGAPVGIRIWAPGEVWALGEYVMPTEANRTISGSGRFFEVSTAGTAGTAEPAWDISGATTDGTAVFTYEAVLTPTTGYAVQSVMQQILNDNGLSSITLATPVSPSWNILPYKQDRTSVFDALRALATQIGWDLRMKWDSGTSAFKLTFYDPNRTKTTPDYTFDSDDYEQLSELSLDKQGVRNVVQVIYGNRSSLAPLGQSKRTILQVSDATSISKYGRLFFEIAEEATSNIDSSAEATTLANAALDDLKEPTVSHTADLAFGFPYAELNDLYRFTANGRHYSSNQDLALVAVSHSVADGIMRTSLSCRGKPTAGTQVWTNANVRPVGSGTIHSTEILATESGITSSSSPIIGGTRLKFEGTSVLRDIPIELEVHVSDGTGFTPSATTLVYQGTSREVEVSKLNPGATYYARFVPWYRNATMLVRGQPSAEFSFVAGRGVSAHMPSEIDFSVRPLNAFLDNRFGDDDRKDDLPDHWTLTAGTLGTQVSSKYDDTAGVGNARTGRYYVRFATSSSTGAIESRPAIVEGGRRYKVSALSKNISGTGIWNIKVYWLKYDQTALSDEAIAQSVTTDVGSWVDRVEYYTAPANARYAKVEVSTATTSTQSFDVDSVRLEEVTEIARYLHTTGASIPNATTTLIDFDTVIGAYSNPNVTTGASWKYTAPRRGFYLVQTALTVVFNNNDSGTCYISIFRNGTENRRMTRQSGHVLREETQYMASATVFLAKGDYVDIRIYQTTGGARSLETGTIQNYVEIIQVG